MRRPLVSIIVATLNTPELTRACLESLLKNTSVSHELILVNNSRSRAVRRCLKPFRDIRLIQNGRNLGYAKAANQGARAAQGKYLCFLNSDTLVPPRWAERLLEAARLPGVGAVSPLAEWEIYRNPLLDHSTPEVLGAFVELADSTFQRRYTEKLRPARWLGGFCLVVPRTVMDRVGPFDERYFFGWEDIDYCLQLRMNGYRLLKLRSIFVYHKRSASSSARRHAQLVRRSESQFLEKWSALLGRRFRNSAAVFSAVDRKAHE